MFKNVENKVQEERFQILPMFKKIIKNGGKQEDLDFTDVQKMCKMKEVDFNQLFILCRV